MATKRPLKPRRTPLEEASDPSTDPERLRQLADNHDDAVTRAVCKNPSVLEDVWQEAVLEGSPEAWDNPMAPIYFLTWTPRENALITPEKRASWATILLWENPERCSSKGKALIAAHVQEWWATVDSATILISFLGAWVKGKGEGSPEHREVLRILVLCVRTIPNLTAQDRQALDLLEAWSAGGADRRKEAYFLVDSEAVKCTIRFAWKSSKGPWIAMYEVLGTIRHTAGEQAGNEHDRLMADVIRGAMPLPPVVA
jgi:hypothetical protein